MKKIRYCKSCDRYTLNRVCAICGKETTINTPQRYVKDEEVAKYRRQIKKELIDKGSFDRV